MSNLKLLYLSLSLALTLGLISCKKNSATNNSSNGNYSPNNQISSYKGYFLYGSNMGSYSGWSDQQLSEILIGNPSKNIEGAGVTSLRAALYEDFVQTWGYNIRSDAFSFYQQLGAKVNVVFLNGPSEAHRDKTKYCNNQESKVFANLYEPIWASSGVINEKNYYAVYVYNLVKTYGSSVKFWEVWNEPDYSNNWNATQTWAKTNPNPCDLTNLYAPIQSYVRMLRITSEIVKSIAPDSFVCLGGIGYEGFLDAVLRNTDNPADGAITSAFPQTGGAWFDCVSFHIYPMYNIKANPNSDAAANSIASLKESFQNVLTKYGYNGTKNAYKDFIITECNIPRKSIDGYIGSDEAQRNFLIKAAVIAQKSNINGLYIYSAADTQPLTQATDPYQVMGFYQPLTSGAYNTQANSSATAWRTVSTLLKDRRYNKAQTDALLLPSNIDGAAFYSEEKKNYAYVLWAKSSGSLETASAKYSLPSSFGLSTTTVYTWDNKKNNGTTSFELSGSPSFILP